MADEDTGRVLSGTVGTLAACLEHLRVCQRCIAALGGAWVGGVLVMSMDRDGHVAMGAAELPAPGVVQPGALDEPGVAQRYEAAGFDFAEVKRTAHAAMDGDRGRLAAAVGASPGTEGSQASREQASRDDHPFAASYGGFIDVCEYMGGDLVRLNNREEALSIWRDLSKAIIEEGWGPLILGVDWASDGD